MICDMNDKENSTIRCHRKIQAGKLAGQKYKYSPLECFTSLGDGEGYCRGNPEGGSCSNNGEADCDVDLYCDPTRKVCLGAVQVGDYCNEHLKCASYLLCAWENGTISDYKCRNYGLYPNGHSLGPGDEDDICQSNYIDDDYYCQEGPKLVSSHLKDTEGESCEYSRGASDESHCWFHGEGKAICKKGALDLMTEWKKALSYLRLSPQCHVSVPMAQCDMGRKVVNTQAEWEDIWYSISRLHWEVHLEGLPVCMRQYVHPETFKYFRSYSGALTSFSALTLLALLLLIF
eukprot:TRINITY_DN629_c0_g1_i5.p1 TRINITY_DN629_c0_g1~~TRINITY_DN629_c0_g1_i5.p1  ORF type:complete len:289 (-),score=63.93 TRINITY_DN629_c0_g1_i5:132-998(-)